MPASESGLMVQGDVKHAKTATIKGAKNVIFAKNDDALEVFTLNELQ